MSTPISNLTPYASAADMIARYDANHIGDLVTDTKVRVTQVQLLAPDPNLLTALKRASGEVEAACLVADHYLPADLASLTGNSLELLKGLVCDLAMWFLEVRRNPAIQPYAAMRAAYETLEAIKNGAKVFGIQEVLDAGLVQTDNISMQQIDQLALSTDQAARLWGVRGKVLRNANTGWGYPAQLP